MPDNNNCIPISVLCLYLSHVQGEYKFSVDNTFLVLDVLNDTWPMRNQNGSYSGTYVHTHTLYHNVLFPFVQPKAFYLMMQWLLFFGAPVWKLVTESMKFPKQWLMFTQNKSHNLANLTVFQVHMSQRHPLL